MSEFNRKAFYRTFFSVVIPIAIQNLINSAVGVADTLMLTFVSQTALAAVSLAGQVQFLLNMVFFGVSAGITMLTAQYWGKGDIESSEKILAIGTKISIAFSALFFAAAVFVPHLVMRVFTNDQGMIDAGVRYLRVIGFSYLFMGFSQPFLSALKCVDKVKESTLINSTALVLNIVLNACFIFGWIPGIPPLGIFGVALATVIARAIEFVLCIIVGERMKSLRIRPRLFTLRSKVLTHDFIHLALPALGNDIAWSLAFSMYSVIMGHLGEDLVAANSIVSTMRNLVSVFGFGVASGTSIILGNIIGSGDLKLAEQNASRLIRLTFLTSLIGSVLILCCHPIVPLIGTLTEQAAEYLHTMIWISSVYVIGGPMNTCLICGVFRAGGDSKFGFICDIVDMWGVFVPLGFLAAFVLKLPPMVVYLILSFDEFAKMPFVFRHYFKKGWLRNITKENTN
ncbi:MAG: MATE family efflux transporter [Clostridia bacterium]|nr:MATE family efflux transporter [Clostridia bacterium]